MAAPREERSMELRYQMTDILPLLPIPQPPHGRSAYNIPVADPERNCNLL